MVPTAYLPVLMVVSQKSIKCEPIHESFYYYYFLFLFFFLFFCSLMLSFSEVQQ